MIGNWQDPNPKPIIEEHNNFYIVRDDLLGGGSKVRFVDYLIKDSKAKEIVYGGCPATGYAQISLPIVCKRCGKKAVLFMANRSLVTRHPYQERALDEGAEIHWVDNGMLTVTLKRARDYANEDIENRFNLPLGLEHETVLASIVRVARSLDVRPTEIWSVGSSGTLNRGLQLAFPDLDCHVVSVGHKMKDRERGRAKLWQSPYKFNQEVKTIERPPFPSVLTYDAKAWSFMLKHARKGALFWNVA